MSCTLLPDADDFSESPNFFFCSESFIHRAFLRPLGQAAFPRAFSHINASADRISIAFLPYFTLDQLVTYRDPDSNDISLLIAAGAVVTLPGRH